MTLKQERQLDRSAIKKITNMFGNFRSNERKITMTRKEKVDLILSKIPEDRKESFISEIREAGNKKERVEIIKKYGASFSEEEKAALKDAGSSEVSDEELDQASGGCNCAYVHCECTGCV